MVTDLAPLRARHPDPQVVEPHFQIISRVVQAAMSRQEVSGIALGGSLVRGCGDAYSDVDLFVFVGDADTSDATSLVAAWVRTIDGIEVALDRGIGPEGHDLVKGLDITGVVVDFHVLTQARLLQLFRWRNRTPIFDRDGTLTHFVEEQVQRWTDAAYDMAVKRDLEGRVIDFWLRYAKAYSYVVRDRLFLASRALWNMTSILAGVVRWKCGALPVAVRAPFHYIETDLPSKELQKLHECLPRTNTQSSYAQAVARTARAFERELPEFRKHPARQLVCQSRPIDTLETFVDVTDEP